ncbi:MAG: BrnA antitoxin family protein [Treponemataceae bacterium]|nr:BrnA antitoxin family protein [Treponemataceae bacterium]MDE7392152.1 BrnA antitoxin family protein [Treponemataceae bacterium]
MAIKTMTLEDVKKLPPLSKERIQEINAFDEKYDDPECPPLTDERLAQAKPLYEAHPDWHKPTKTEVHMRVDTDVLEWYKSQGKGYQTKMNAVLRAYAFG